MTPLYRAQQIKTHEGPAAEAIGLSLYDLMERAGAAVLNHFRQQYPKPNRLLVLCGAGNNGGDGYVVARLAQQKGWNVQVAAWREPDALTGDARRAADAYRDAGGTVEPLSAVHIHSDDLVVDALWGTGLDRPLPDDVAAFIQRLNDSPATVISVDIPSGLHADTGAVLGAAVRANLTISLVAYKVGLFTGQANDCTGILMLDDLGIGAEFTQRATTNLSLNDAPVPFPTRRARTAHKGHFGQVMVVGGHSGMAGAARMAGEACLRVGAGRVTVAVHPDSRLLTGAGCPELMVHGIAHPEVLGSALDSMTHLLVGPGLGQDDWSEAMWHEALRSGKPLLLDADGLNWLARHPKQPLPMEFIGTPHPGEAARLLKCSVADIERDRFTALNELCRVFGGVWVLKGAGTLIGNGQQCFVNTSGNPGMATGGMGDVLTGVIGGLWAQGLDALSAARCGVYGHGWAADQTAAEQGERGLLATDPYPALRRWINTSDS
ncbi:MAG: NAD(P)H-hydrate dehydratase [Natronospirillum sp.]